MRTQRRTTQGIARRRAERRAFTLLELTLVILIITTLSMVAVPKLSNSIAIQSVEAGARRIAADLEFLKGRAIKTSSPQTFRLIPTTTPGYTLVGQSHPDFAAQAYTILFARDCHGITLSSYSLGGNQDLIFDMYGMPDSGGQLVITRGGQTRTISVNSESGIITVSS